MTDWPGSNADPWSTLDAGSHPASRFSPRLADIGGARLWRIDPNADYGLFNDPARHRVNLSRIAENWDDCLWLIGSLKLGRVRATSIMRTPQVGEHATRLAQAIAEIGRIDKTVHVLRYLDALGLFQVIFVPPCRRAPRAAAFNARYSPKSCRSAAAEEHPGLPQDHTRGHLRVHWDAH